MSFTDNKEGGRPMVVAPRTLEKAKEVAHTMLQSGETKTAVNTPDGQPLAFVSTDKDALVSVSSFEVEGTTFYLGNER